MPVDPAYASTLFRFLEQLRGCFTSASWRYGLTFTIGYVMTRRHPTIRGLFGYTSLAQRRHYSSFTPFFSRYRWSIARVADGRLKICVHLLGIKAVVLIVDDPLCPKTGPEIFGVSVHPAVALAAAAGGAGHSRRGRS